MSKDEKVYEELIKLMDLKDWESSRQLITKMIKANRTELVKRLVKYYRYHVCQQCLGIGEVTSGTLDNKEIIKCECTL